MTKTYELKNLGCASCAQKIQDKVQTVDGVSKVQVDFFMQKMVLESETSNFADIEKNVKKIIDRIEPDVILKEK